VPTFPAAPPTLTPATRRQLASLRQQVAGWQQAVAGLTPLFGASPSLAEYAPLSIQLGLVANLLGPRLAQIEQGQPLVPAAQAAAKAQLDAAQKPVGQVELAIIGAARRLLGL